MAHLLGCLAGPEDPRAVRPAGVLGARRAGAGPGRPGPAWTPAGTVLVTGATGAVGTRLARWLAARGAEHLLLVSRRGADAPGAEDLRAELTAAGTRVTLAGCDLTDADAVARLLDAVPADVPLGAVFHTAAVLDDATLGTLTPERAAAVLRPKVDGALILDRLTRDADLSAFVLFSSLAGTVPNDGQASYAAANAFLDAFAAHRRAAGRVATSIAWGSWGGGGAVTAAADERLSRQGVRAMDPDLALAALGRVLDAGEESVVVADIDWDRFLPAVTAVRPAPLLSDLTPVRTGSDPDPDRDDLARRLSGVGETEQGRILLDVVRTATAETLGFAGTDLVGRTRSFRDLGTNSVSAVALRNRLAAATGLRLSVSLVFDHPTPAELAEHLRLALTGDRADPAPAVGRPRADEPIAIVSMACRFPGSVRTPEDLWQVLATGADVMSPFPTDRGWDVDGLYHPDPEHRGTTYARAGGFLHDAADFDAGFFAIGPREALAMDPQQRLLLETAWEACERAGLDPTALKGRPVGVFVGAGQPGYGGRLDQLPDTVEGYGLTGAATSVVSGRISYALGLEGPAVTVDTACSSALVSLHLAAQSLRSGECDLALAGGVSVLASPVVFVEFSRQRGLSPDGRCKSFAAAADGTGWSEGAGLVVLERLSDAERHGHPVLAVIRGSAVNQDGASNGLSAPSGPAQQRVIRQALGNAGLSPSDVDAVEAHGTGTTLGDPIEAEALLATYGQEHDADRPLWLGSVKSNIGHTQAAAGIAGVMKMVLAMRHGRLPRTLHVDAPSPHVDWDSGHLRLLTEDTAWPDTGRPRRAGVSAFGISGTNAHLVLEQGPPAAAAPADVPAGDTLVPLVLSARDAAALPALAARIRTRLDEPGTRLLDVGFSLASTRAALDHRAVVLATDPADARAGLAAVGDPDAPATVISGVARDGELLTAFLFSGQGSQRPGMGLELAERFPAFAGAFDAVCAELDRHLDRPIREVLAGDAELLDRTGYTQPALFAVEVALFHLVTGLGVRPDFLLGHSVGELAAAHVAGVLSLEDACELVAARGRLMQALPAGGAMVAVQATEQEVLAGLNGHGDRVGVAAVNAQSSIVLAGDEDAVLAVADGWARQGRRTRRLRVSHAFHSPRMDDMLAEFRRVAERMSYAPPRIPVISNLTGEPARDDELCSPGYWVRHARESVRFADGVRHLDRAGVGAYVELGPDGALTSMVREGLADRPAVTVAALRRTGAEPVALLTALAELHVAGGRVAWDRVCAGGRPVPLPTYPFQHQRYWLTAPTGGSGPVDGDFWAAVDAGNVEDLAGALGLDGLADDAPVGSILPALAAWHRRQHDRHTRSDRSYRLNWRPVSPPAATADGTWLLLDPGTPWASAVQRELSVRGGQVVRVTTAEAVAAAGDVRGIVSLAGGPRLLADAVGVVQASGSGPLWWVTTGAVSIGAGDPVLDPDQAQLWGLGRVLAVEEPRRWGGLVDLPSHPDATAVTRLVDCLTAATEDQLAVRASGVFGARLVRSGPPRGRPGPDPVTGTVLLTGGTPATRSHLAGRLTAHGTDHAVLLGAPHPAADGDLDDRITVEDADPSDPAAVRRVVGRLRDAGEQVRAVIHLVADEPLSTLDGIAGDRFVGAAGARAAAVTGLVDGLGDDPVTLVLLASAAGVWGGRGYAAAAVTAAFTDALADRRRSRGRPATSVLLGPWSTTAPGTGPDEERLRQHGLTPMPAEEVLSTVEEILGREESGVLLADADWDRLAPVLLGGRTRHLLDDLPDAAAPAAADAVATALPADFADRSAADRERLLVDLVRAGATRVLAGTGTEEVDPTRAFRDLGFDSLAATELARRLGTACGITVAATAIFDHPNATALARHLAAELGGGPADAGEAVLAHLGRLEGSLAALAEDDVRRAQAASYLRTLVATLDRPAAAPTDSGTDGDLAASSDDELFDILDRGFGPA